MTAEELGRKVKAKYPQYRNMSDEEVGRKTLEKYPQYGNAEAKQSKQVESQPEKKRGGFMSALQASITPAKEAYQGLKTLYGGSEQGIASKLMSDVKEGAKDMERGNYRKGALKSGGRVAADVAGTIFAPVGAALQATGVNKAFDYVGRKFGESRVGQAIQNNKTVQDFAMAHPNAEEDFGRILNLALSGGGGKVTKSGLKDVVTLPTKAVQNTVISAKNVGVDVKNAVNRAKASKVLDVSPETIAKERQAKLNAGYSEQNARLKSADKSFNKNTKTYTEASVDPATGTPTVKKTKVTPIDTFSKHNIAPEIERGAIQMGDYNTGTGALGKIKSAVAELEVRVDESLAKTVKMNKMSSFKEEVRKQIKNSDELQESGTVESTLKKLDSVFDDYQRTYGDTITDLQINKIRKRMNRKFNPETEDVQRAIGDAGRELIYATTKDGSVKSLLREMGELLSAKKYAETINGTKVTGGRLGNYAARTAGAVIGSTVKNAPIVGPVVGMLGGEMAARLLQQTQFRSAWTELKALLQSKSSEPSQRAKIIPKTESIPYNYKSESVKKVGNPIPTISRYAEKFKGKGGLNLQTVGGGKAGYSDPIILKKGTKRGFGTGAGRPKTITKAQDSKITKSSLQEVLQDGAREYIKRLENAKTIDFDAIAKYQDLIKRAPKITDIQSLTRNIAELERKSKLKLMDEAIKIRNEVFDGLRKKNLKK